MCRSWYHSRHSGPAITYGQSLRWSRAGTRSSGKTERYQRLIADVWTSHGDMSENLWDPVEHVVHTVLPHTLYPELVAATDSRMALTTIRPMESAHRKPNLGSAERQNSHRITWHHGGKAPPRRDTEFSQVFGPLPTSGSLGLPSEAHHMVSIVRPQSQPTKKKGKTPAADPITDPSAMLGIKENNQCTRAKNGFWVGKDKPIIFGTTWYQ